MKFCTAFILFILSIFSCTREIKLATIPNQSIDTVAIIKNSLQIKSAIDTLIKHKKTLGGIACGTKFSYEVDRDSCDNTIKSTLYYFPINSVSDTTRQFSETVITTYFADQKVVFANIKHSTDLWESINFEQNVYVDEKIQIEEQVTGNIKDMPTDIQEVIKNTL